MNTDKLREAVKGAKIYLDDGAGLQIPLGLENCLETLIKYAESLLSIPSGVLPEKLDHIEQCGIFDQGPCNCGAEHYNNAIDEMALRQVKNGVTYADVYQTLVIFIANQSENYPVTTDEVTKAILNLIQSKHNG